jgi:hypothetical protein
VIVPLAAKPARRQISIAATTEMVRAAALRLSMYSSAFFTWAALAKRSYGENQEVGIGIGRFVVLAGNVKIDQRQATIRLDYDILRFDSAMDDRLLTAVYVAEII